ncbi:hypothetical protein NDU88_003663 [Pleurodeles waltl]|uniref:Uncharacterized protein n=1 Tax=Pleurodeles waltl TaxID=8319 RepID=A0AAV7UDG6_PLEWA|nr:hypothetical protein NDU88_003663 [Pleurodeles waltl]
MFAGHGPSPVAPPMSPVLLAGASSKVCSRADGRLPRKLITSFFQKVDKPLLPQQTIEKTIVKLKEKEGSSVQGGDMEKNYNVNDHGVDEDGEPDECLVRDRDKRAAGSIAEGTELILAGSLGFVPVDEEAKVVEEKICENLCFRPKRQLSGLGFPRLSNGLRFVNGRSKSDGAAKANFDNGRSQSVIDYFIVNVEAWPAILDMAVNLARYLRSGPRWGFRSGHSELPMVAGLRPKPLQTAHSRKDDNSL